MQTALNPSETATFKVCIIFFNVIDVRNAIIETKLPSRQLLQVGFHKYHHCLRLSSTLSCFSSLILISCTGQRLQQRFGGETQGGYYGNRMSVGRPDNFVENYGNTSGQPSSSRRFSQRVNSDPALYGSNSQSLCPAHGHHQSYDTVASASGNESHGTDQWGNSTDPSSENSSIDRLQQQPPKSEIADAYGFNGFGGALQLHGPILEEHGLGAPTYGQPGYGQPLNVANRGHPYQGNGIPPAPPPHAPRKDDLAREPIKLGNAPLTEISPSNANAEKRKSWLRKRFSKG